MAEGETLTAVHLLQALIENLCSLWVLKAGVEGGGGDIFCVRRAAQMREKRTGNPTAGIKTRGKL